MKRKIKYGKELCLLVGGSAKQLYVENEFFTRLVTINFTYIDQYYRQTQEQANKSFWLSASVAVVGFIMVCAGVVLLYVQRIDAGYVTVVSGAISEFVSAVFFYLYNRTILAMGQYHQKLVITQNVSLALKTAETLTGTNKEDAQLKIIERLTDNVNGYLASARIELPLPKTEGTRRKTRETIDADVKTNLDKKRV
jgi:hypothetical protein